MNNLYDLHSWSKHYREEALREAGRRHLVERERAETHAERGVSTSLLGGTRWGCCTE